LLRVIIWILEAGPRPPSTAYGSARWATWFEILRGGAWSRRGLVLGKKFGRLIRFRGEGYALVFGPTRSGKGVSIIIPSLLEWRGSVIVNDCKGENYAVTARDRARRGAVWSLNLSEPELSDYFNPLDMVRVGTVHEADDALELAQLLIVPDSQGSSHWDKRAGDLLQCLILYVLHRYQDTPELRNLAKVRSLISLGWQGLQPIFTEASELGPTTLRELGSGFLGNGVSDEARSVWSNADKAIGLFSGDRPAGLITMRSSFDMMAFNRQVASLFLIIDEEKLPIYGGFLRLMVGCALMAMTRAKSEPTPRVPTLFVLDEAAALGRLEPLETGVGYLAAYAKMILVFQDLNQLELTYPKARSIIANATVKVAFAANDIATATMLARTIGQATVQSHSSSKTRKGQSEPKTTNESSGEAARYLIDPAEIMRMPRNQVLIFFSGKVAHPILAKKIMYFKELRWSGRWDRWRKKSAKAPASAWARFLSSTH